MTNALQALSHKAKEGFLRVMGAATHAVDDAVHAVKEAVGGHYRAVSAVVVRDDRGRFLIVRKPRKAHMWQFPQGGIDAGETPLSAAYRELAEECGDVDVEISPEPIGEYSYDFPADFTRHDTHTRGATVMFFLGEYTDGMPLTDGHELIDHLWVEGYELADFFAADYYARVRSLVPDLPA